MLSLLYILKFFFHTIAYSETNKTEIERRELDNLTCV